MHCHGNAVPAARIQSKHRNGEFAGGIIKVTARFQVAAGKASVHGARLRAAFRPDRKLGRTQRHGGVKLLMHEADKWRRSSGITDRQHALSSKDLDRKEE